MDFSSLRHSSSLENDNRENKNVLEQVTTDFSEMKTNDDDNMQDSCMTAPTETGSISEDESLGWLGGITADIKTLASTIKETAGGVATFVKTSAMAVASEIAHLEEEEMAHKMEQYEHQYDENITLHLPWEVQSFEQDCYEEDAALKQKIMALSTKEDTFLQPYSFKDVDDSTSKSAMSRPPFVLDEPRIRLVRRILDLDEKLAAMHARLSGRSDVKEAVFWQNYFFNCEMAREEYFVLSQPPSHLHNPVAELGSFEEATEIESSHEGSYIEIPSPPVSQKSCGSLVLVAPNDRLDLP